VDPSGARGGPPLERGLGGCAEAGDEYPAPLMPAIDSRLPRVLFAVSTGVCLQVFVLLTHMGGNPVDALCYWLTNPADPYNRVDFQFVYPPVAAQLMAPLFTLPFAVFVALLRMIELASLVLLGGPIAAPLLFAPPVTSEVNAANINLLLGVVMVLGFRWPAMWAIPLLTKPSLGVGLVWFAVRGEWRKAATPIAIAGVLAGGSLLLTPHLWSEWLALLANGTAQVGEAPYPYSIWARFPIALAIVIWGARTNQPWTVVVASALALPRLYYQSPAILVALIPMLPRVGRIVVPWTYRLGRLDDLAEGRRGRRQDDRVGPEAPAASVSAP
jgi:hypothetical protein